jgi:hypothetical protein
MQSLTYNDVSAYVAQRQINAVQGMSVVTRGVDVSKNLFLPVPASQVTEDIGGVDAARRHAKSKEKRKAATIPSTGQEGTGQLPSGQPATTQLPSQLVASGLPACGQLLSGQPATGQPATGQLLSGLPANGQLLSGQPTTGQPASGQPTTGQPASGLPASGQLPSSQPTTGQQPTVRPASTGRANKGKGKRKIVHKSLREQPVSGPQPTAHSASGLQPSVPVGIPNVEGPHATPDRISVQRKRKRHPVIHDYSDDFEGWFIYTVILRHSHI